MREPDAQTFELDYWELIQISSGLARQAEAIKRNIEKAKDDEMDKAAALKNYEAVQDLRRLFSFGTLTVILKLDGD